MSPTFLRDMLQVFVVALSLTGIVAATEAETKPETSAEPKLKVLPESIQLYSPEDRHGFLVHTVSEHDLGPRIPLDELSINSSDESIAVVEKGQVVPVGNGVCELVVKHGEQTARLKVHCRNIEQPKRWNFATEVQSVLSRHGCNSGACHGAAAGKNGFRLSLRGYDAGFDYFALTREARGRRVVPSEPGKSLLVTKPTGIFPHKGGIKFDTESRDFQVLTEWIAQGHPGPSATDPKLSRLEILPKHATLSAGEELRMLVLAHFDDGRVMDVTAWSKFTGTNDSVARIDEHGVVNVTGGGQGSVVAWHLAQNVVSTIMVPQDIDIQPETWKEQPANFIDEQVLAKLKLLNIPPSPLASDQEFLRRVSLDAIGTLPTADEVRAFLDDDDPNKRAKLIDELLGRKEFVDFWAYKWSDLLLVSGLRLRPEAVKAYHGWIRESVANDKPWDQFARDIVTARGSTLKNGAANFYALHQDPLIMSETTSMAFLGMSINCARCHDHPLEKWTNDDYYAMASLFARVRGKGWGGDARSGNGDRTIFVADKGEVIQPRTGEPRRPAPLDGAPIDFETDEDRREYLADWLTSPENPYFTRAIVNRVWASYFDVGLVDKVDDLRLTNPASNPELHAALAGYLVEHDYDLKSLMRLIMNSKTYQRSSQTLPENAGDTRFYSHYYTKRLKAEILLDAISQATGVPTEYSQARQAGGGIDKVNYEPGTRAIELPDTSVVSYFLKTFGRPERLVTCECERSDEPSMVQVLHIMNGTTVNQKLAKPDSLPHRYLEEGWPLYRIVEQAYLSSLSRYPTDAEMQQILSIVSQEQDKKLLVEDLYWSLLSSKEFLFNH